MISIIIKTRYVWLAAFGIIFYCTGCNKDADPIPLSEIPSIMSVDPGEGTVGTELTITGINFNTNTVVMVGDKLATSIEISSSNLIYAKVPSGIAANVLLPVKIKNPTGGEATLNNAFKAISPLLSFVNSATKPSGNVGSTVILEGKAFGDTKGQGKVLFSDGAGGTIPATILSDEDWTDNFIVTTVPNGAQDGPVVIETETGLSNDMSFKITTAATFSPSTINWKTTTILPVAVSGHKALSIPVDDASNTTNQYVLVSGGRNGNGEAIRQVVIGKINADGTISSWASATDLPGARSFHASVAATPFSSKGSGSGYVYVLGGINGSGEVVNTVSVAKINNDGTLQSWNNARALPQAIHSAGAVIFRSTIYIAGGAASDSSPVSTVYKSKISESGELGEWEAVPGLPVAVAYHGFVTFGGYLYSVGGETSAATPDAGSQISATQKIYYSKINLRTGEIGDWSENTSAIGKERSKHTTLVLGGNIFVSSGLYSGLSGGVGGSSENIYANINADGSIGSFNGATGSNTLFTTGANNLFNQAGISYIDADGVAHVMILGGAKVGAPATKLDKVMYY
jgi:hypothetical protein